MKEMFNQVFGKVHFSKEQLQVLVIMIVLLLLIVAAGAPSDFGGWGGF